MFIQRSLEIPLIKSAPLTHNKYTMPANTIRNARLPNQFSWATHDVMHTDSKPARHAFTRKGNSLPCWHVRRWERFQTLKRTPTITAAVTTAICTRQTYPVKKNRCDFPTSPEKSRQYMSSAANVSPRLPGDATLLVLFMAAILALSRNVTVSITDRVAETIYQAIIFSGFDWPETARAKFFDFLCIWNCIGREFVYQLLQ
jgi:hypothetical protein